jgi:flagellar hook protein FlgE
MVGFTQALQGLSRSEAQFGAAAARIARFPVATAAGASDSVDLSAAAVALMQSRNSFEANTKLIKVADQMDQALLDMIG